MKTIKLSDYKQNMGILIDVEDEFQNIKYAKSIKYEKILYNFSNILDKNKSYFIVCDKGKKSRKLTQLLTIYGYDVTNVIK